jgi:hypothetical protein
VGRRWIDSGGGVYIDDAIDDSGARAVAGDLGFVDIRDPTHKPQVPFGFAQDRLFDCASRDKTARCSAQDDTSSNK